MICNKCRNTIPNESNFCQYFGTEVHVEKQNICKKCGVEYPDGTCVIDYIDELVEYQKAFMEKVSEIRSINMMTFPVLTYALLRIDGKFVDEDFAKWCCKHNMKWADSNFFISKDVTSLSNCCRLVSDVKNLG